MFTKASSGWRSLLYFFMITFAWTCLLQSPRLLAAAGWITLPAWTSSMLGYAAVFGPAVAAFGLTGLSCGKDGMRELWQRGWRIRFRRVWLLPALLLVPLCGLLTLGLLTAAGVSIPWEYSLPPAMLVPVGLMIWLLGALPEEYGWRGYALDRLQVKLSPLAASLVLGVIWSLWHLPLHFIPGTTQSGIPFMEFTAQIIVLSVLYTWLHNHTGGSVLIAGLFHAGGNLTSALLPTYTTPMGRWLGLLPLLAAAVVIVAKGSLYTAGRSSRLKKAVLQASKVN